MLGKFLYSWALFSLMFSFHNKIYCQTLKTRNIDYRNFPNLELTNFRLYSGKFWEMLKDDGVNLNSKETGHEVISDKQKNSQVLKNNTQIFNATPSTRNPKNILYQSQISIKKRAPYNYSLLEAESALKIAYAGFIFATSHFISLIFAVTMGVLSFTKGEEFFVPFIIFAVNSNISCIIDTPLFFIANYEANKAMNAPGMDGLIIEGLAFYISSILYIPFHILMSFTSLDLILPLSILGCAFYIITRTISLMSGFRAVTKTKKIFKEFHLKNVGFQFF